MKKRIISLLVALGMVFSMLPQLSSVVNAEVIKSGTCGQNIIWELGSDGTLVISGNGEMPDYSSTSGKGAPWESQRNQIKRVKIENGITYIGRASFYRCENLVDVNIPDSVVKFGASVFLGCSNLESFVFPQNIQEVRASMFEYCNKLDNIVIPNGVDTIGYSAFRYCSNLSNITIPQSVTTIDSYAFSSCESLKDVHYAGTEQQWDIINIDDFNNELKNATIHFQSAEEGSVYDFPYAYTVKEIEQMVVEYYNDSMSDSEYPGEGKYVVFSSETQISESMCSMVVRFQGTNATVANIFIADVTVDMLTGEMFTRNVSQGFLWEQAGLNADDSNVIANSYSEMLSQGAYVKYVQENAYNYEYTVENGEMTYNFALVDINQDGKQELIVDAMDMLGWFADLIFTQSADGSVKFLGSLWTYSSVEYSAEHSALSYIIAKPAFGEVPYAYVKFSETGIIDYSIQEYDDSFEQLVWMTLDEMLLYLQSNVIEESVSKNGLVIYSDYSNLSIRKNSVITLAAGILADGERSDDVSGINFQIEDTSILKMSTTDIKNNCRYVKLKGLAEGTTTVTFTDSNTGYTATVPITVYDDNYLSYTLNSVPTQNIEKYPTNIYNANGLYVDSYEYTINDGQSATVSFDVYNTNYIYGVVEVFDENGNMKDAVLIEKMTSSNTSIKEALWDNIGYLVSDIVDGDLLSYRQESGYSKKTSVSVKIPKNGYIKITTDPENSLIVGLVNSVDGLMSMASLAGDIKDFDVNSKEFSQKLTKKLLADQIYIELIKDGSDASKDLWENVGKETFITSESMGSFTDTITKNIDELKLGSIIADTAADFGWDIGENVFTYFAGPAGTALNIMFTIGKVENLIIQQNDLIQSAGVGSIYIQNQGGGFRACQQIKVESDDSLSSDTALNVFTVTLDSTILDIIKDVNPEIYEAMSDGITRTYNISLIKSGEETQPNGKVTVYIPISEDFKALAYAGDLTGKIKIYRVEEDGGLTEMDVEIDDGCFVFTTDHFSLYTVVGYDFEDAKLQDDGKMNLPLIIGIAFVAVVAIGAVSIIVFKRKKKS